MKRFLCVLSVLTVGLASEGFAFDQYQLPDSGPSTVTVRLVNNQPTRDIVGVHLMLLSPEGDIAWESRGLLAYKYSQQTRDPVFSIPNVNAFSPFSYQVDNYSGPVDVKLTILVDGKIIYERPIKRGFQGSPTIEVGDGVFVPAK